MKFWCVLEQVSLLPPVAAIAATAVAGPSADALIARGWPVASVRRLAQATAFLGPAACLTAAAFSEDGPQTVGTFATRWCLARSDSEDSFGLRHDLIGATVCGRGEDCCP